MLFSTCATHYAVVVWIALVMLAGLPVRAQMSPGPLARPHSSLDSPLKCGECHSFGVGEVRYRCLECHAEIRRLLAEAHGYHARVIRKDKPASDCARCHAEHNGRAHQLIRWPVPPPRFDHTQAGLALEGEHRALPCGQCHNPKFIASDFKPLLRRADLSRSYVGLSPTCTSCHADVHRAQLGAGCRRCHGLESWKRPPGFDHQSTRFPLTGKHSTTECNACHLRLKTPDARPDYRNFVFYENCRSCHRDPHGGGFAQDCQPCHTTNAWLPASRSGFQHDSTRFPLKGRHAALACRKCHPSQNFGAALPHARCLDCHKDLHRGQFARRPDQGDCGACHLETGFRPASFSVSDHQSTSYPLTGLHAKVACTSCHPSRAEATDFHPSSDRCQICHRDPHSGQFRGSASGDSCDRCHQTSGFRPALFGVADHRLTRFPLAGSHLAVPCAECHRAPAPASPLRYHFDSFECQSCHRNPHGPLGAHECSSCHTLRSWSETGAFDHSLTPFPLLGHHRSAACRSCHKPVERAALRTLPFARTPRNCAACHDDIHAGQFVDSRGLPECARCHTVQNWQPTGFDHSRHSSFSLAGAHADVPCRLCHTNRRPAGARNAIVYRGTPTSCRECHQ